jgi:protein O-GlcNAc transferase
VIVGVIVCVGALGVFLLRRLWMGSDEGKPAPASAPRVWSDPEWDAEPEEIAKHLKEEGFEVARTLMEELPGKADPIFFMGQVHYRHGDSERAIAFWIEGLEIDPERADAYDGMGHVALRKGEYELAISHWRKALEIQPNMPDVYNSMSKALMALGKTQEAAEALEKDVRISPRSSLSLFALGQAHLQLKQYDKAKPAYEKAIEIDPKMTNAYYGLGTVFVRLGEREKALECMKRFQELKAEDLKILDTRNKAHDDMIGMRDALAEMHVDAGRIYRKYGKLDPAEGHWRRAASLDPTNTSSRLELAALCERTRRIPEAVRMYEEVRAAEPRNLACCLSLAALHARSGDFAGAERAFKEAIEMAPEISWGYRGLAQLYLDAKRNVREAKDLAQKTVELEPTAGNFDLLGRAFYMNGNMEGALSALGRAMALDPTNQEYKHRYEKLRRSQ